VSLNIKNERVHELVREAARRTGQSQTSVVEAALEAYLRELDAARDARTERLRAVLDDFDRLLSDADRAAMSTDDLYDEAGLPR
jgi:antitoxin VapB